MLGVCYGWSQKNLVAQTETFISWTIVSKTLSPTVYQLMDNKTYGEKFSQM
jgi:hypothetical protein